MERCRRFLATKTPDAAKRAGQAIERHFLLLEQTPDIGRPLTDMPDMRVLIIPFGESGYVALFRYEPAEDTVYVLAFKHQRETKF
ncbi:type II toxin-antitoxin system RelE/ParE family toxin [Allorhizobium taibaishanense]|nr:type II toxin-antitoxin system RelE/ParE family toxin [Allorhizobium taibaishanense]MBB4007114.1 plasmid stabilization system protein ParE [Allorhizobium taibaishanense]